MGCGVVRVWMDGCLRSTGLAAAAKRHGLKPLYACPQGRASRTRRGAAAAAGPVPSPNNNSYRRLWDGCVIQKGQIDRSTPSAERSTFEHQARPPMPSRTSHLFNGKWGSSVSGSSGWGGSWPSQWRAEQSVWRAPRAQNSRRRVSSERREGSECAANGKPAFTRMSEFSSQRFGVRGRFFVGFVGFNSVE